MWDRHTPLEETLSTLDDLVREGKVRYIGASNFAGWHLAKALGISALHELGAVRLPAARVLAHHPRRRARADPAVSERGPRRHPVEPARRRHPHGQVHQGRRLPVRYPRRRHREPDHVHLPPRRPRVEHRRRGEGRRGEDRQDRGADLAELGGQPPGGHRAHHRRPQPGPARGQPRRRRLASSTTRPARPCRGPARSGSATPTSSSSTPAEPDERSTMELRQLGRTGTRVTEVCLGAMTFGRETAEDESREILARYLDAGGNFVDTANTYNRGASEEILGRLLAGRRDAIVLATKCRMPMGSGPNDKGASASRHPRAGRGVAPPAADRLDRPVPDPLLGRDHAARGDGLDPRRPRARGEGPVRRREQLHRLAARHRARRGARARLGAVRLAAAAVLTGVPRHRARAAPARGPHRSRRPAVESARWRSALGQVPPG